MAQTTWVFKPQRCTGIKQRSKARKVNIEKFSQNAENVCIPYLKGKQHRLPFKDRGKKTNNLLELVHTDVCGPIETPAMNGTNYFVTFVDNYSKKAFTYLMKHKNEVKDIFEEFCLEVENETDRKIKILRFDNGLEYISKELRDRLKASGIKHQTTIRYTPEQNRVSERMNRTIVERAKCMLFNAGLPKSYWGEAVLTATYLINRSPTSRIPKEIPEEQWTETKQDLSHLCVFGCRAFAHVPKELRQK